jgi:hypothetical protein
MGENLLGAGAGSATWDLFLGSVIKGGHVNSKSLPGPAKQRRFADPLARGCCRSGRHRLTYCRQKARTLRAPEPSATRSHHRRELRYHTASPAGLRCLRRRAAAQGHLRCLRFPRRRAAPAAKGSALCARRFGRAGSKFRTQALNYRLLKKSVRFRNERVRRGIFCQGRVVREEWTSGLGHFRFLFRPLDTLRPSEPRACRPSEPRACRPSEPRACRPSEPRAWAGGRCCRRPWRTRTRRGLCRGRAP